MEGYKAFTHALQPPVQGGESVWDGSLPFTTPIVPVDPGPKECSFGWNFCETAEGALEIAGFWPDGWGVRLFRVEAEEAICRGKKRRADSLTVLEEVSVEAGIRALSTRWFGGHAEYMATEELAWHRALCRPECDPEAVERGLRVALSERSLTWDLKRLGDSRGVSAAWAAWDAWDARAARAAWDAWAARAARAAWAAWAAWAAGAAWAAWAAWDALSIAYAARREWIDRPATLLTAGLRDAYAAGLGVTVPTGVNELGWAMAGGNADATA